jgi:acetyl-CoA acetyltransferase
VTGLSRGVAVAGVGYSPISRNAALDINRLTFTACKAALDDAGLAPSDVDAVVEYQFGMGDAPTAIAAQRLLGIRNLNMFNDIMGSGPSGLASAMDAAMAIASGVCNTALIYRCMTKAAGHTGAVRTEPAPAAGPLQYTEPYGLAGLGVLHTMGMRKQRRIQQLGGSEEDYGYIAINARRWGALNERAVLRDPITMDDYLASRPVADPLRLLDCDYPVSGCSAAVLTTTERATDLAQPPVVVDALAYGTGDRPDWTFGADLLFGGSAECAQRLWSTSSVGPADVDVAALYDGFTHIAISWIEALGFCGIGEFGEWVDHGRAIGPGGSLPLNTHGGQLSEGRMHGLAFLTEATLQLRGQCGDRQVPDAEVAIVANALGPQCGAMVLTRG